MTRDERALAMRHDDTADNSGSTPMTDSRATDRTTDAGDTTTSLRDERLGATGTTAGADVTSRMTGSGGRHSGDRDGDGVPDRQGRRGLLNRSRNRDRDGDGVPDRDERGGMLNRDRDGDGVPDREEHGYEQRVRPAVYRPAKTSAAAAFALVFGVAALFCGLTGILAPVAVLLGLIGIVLGVVGVKMSRRPGVTGRGVAIGGLVTSLIAVLLGAAVMIGLAVYVNDQGGLDRLQTQIDKARDNLPTGSQIVDKVPGQ